MTALVLIHEMKMDVIINRSCLDSSQDTDAARAFLVYEIAHH